MENNKLIKAQSDLVKQVGNAISITNKLLSKPDEPLLIPYRRKDKWGFCLPDKTIVIECIFDFADRFRGEFARVAIDNKYGYINTKGEFLINCEFDSDAEYNTRFSEGIVLVRKDDKYLFIDNSGNYLNSNYYEAASPFLNGIAKVNKNNKIGYIDRNGNQIINFLYDSGSSFNIFNKYAIVNRNQQWLIIDKEGTFVKNFPYNSSIMKYCIENRMNIINEKGLHGFLNNRLENIIPCVYKYSRYYFSEGLVGAWKNHYEAGYIDVNGDEVIPFIYHNLENFTDGLAGVCLRDKWGFVNKHNELVIPILYDEVGEFSEGLAPIKFNGKWGYINTEGIVVIEPVFEDAAQFNDGLARVVFEKKAGYIDQFGNHKIKCLYKPNTFNVADDMFFFTIGLKWVTLGDNRDGFINIEGIEYWED